VHRRQVSPHTGELDASTNGGRQVGRCRRRCLRSARCGAGAAHIRAPAGRFTRSPAARLAPARISIAAAAARVIHVSGMTLRKPLPTAIAIAATDHSASTDPIPTATGSWYRAARPAVRIWVRSDRHGHGDRANDQHRHLRCGVPKTPERPPRPSPSARCSAARCALAAYMTCHVRWWGESDWPAGPGHVTTDMGSLTRPSAAVTW